MGRQALTVTVSGLALLAPGARRSSLYVDAVRRAFAREKSRRGGEVCVIFLSRKAMRALNQQFLGHDYDTDVISFDHADGSPESEAIGDIYVSAWLAARQAREQRHSLIIEALTLVAHGALHILGHDDSTPRLKTRMFRAQDAIVAGLLK